MKTILALIDFSDVTPKILDQAHALARTFGSDVVLLHIVPPDPVVVDFEPPAAAPEVFEARRRSLFFLRDSLASRGVQVTAEQHSGVLLDTILEQVTQLNPDLIIMGSHGHGALYHLIIGSVTEGVIKHANKPVLVVPSVPVPQKQPVKAAVPQARPETEMTGVMGGFPLPP